MVLTGRQYMGKQRSPRGNRLETTGSPAAIEEESRHWRRADDRRVVGRCVDDATPLAHQLERRECWKHFHEWRDDRLADAKAATLHVGRATVEASAEHEFALVGLADIDAIRGRQHDRVEARLDRLADHRLQRVA